MTLSSTCTEMPSSSHLPEHFFDFALDQLTWQSIRDRLSLDESLPRTVAQSGPWLLQVNAETDPHASLDDWTSEEESPALYQKQKQGNLLHIGLIVEVNVNGLLLAQDSCWAIAIDFSSYDTERADYEHILSMIKELTRSCLVSIPTYLDRKIQDLQHAAQVFTGFEQPYHQSVSF